MNGMIKRKSRYLTLSAVSRKAGPRLAIIASATKPGNSAMRQVGQKPYHTISPKRIARLTAKSTSATTAEDAGMMRRGKYTLPTRLALPTKLFEASLRIVEKRNHG